MAITSITEATINRKVQVFPSGIKFGTNKPCTNTPPQGVRRGKISGFSRESAQRLRERLIKCDFGGAFCLALTSPPYAPQSPEDAWREIAKHAGRYDVWAAIWRKEVMRNGTPHYHLVVWAADGVLPACCAAKLVEAWVQALFRGAGPEVLRAWMDERCKRSPEIRDSLADMPDVLEQCARRAGGLPAVLEDCRRVNMSPRNFRIIDDSLGYIRYLLDHTSKHKEYQSHTTGRAWGVIGKPPEVAGDLSRLSYEEFALLLRCLRKQSRYRQYCPCIFGHRRQWGKRYRFALGAGQHVQFGAGLDRLVAWILRQRTDAVGCAIGASVAAPIAHPTASRAGGVD